MATAEINGFEMYYEVNGAGPALVMIHGGLGGGEGCWPLMLYHSTALSRFFQVIAYDRRAAGRSATPEDGYSIANYAADLRALLEHLEIDRANILGSSAGGPIALQFALDYPQLARTLLLINTMTYAQEAERAVRQRELDGMKQVEAAAGKEAAVEAGIMARWPGLKETNPERFEKLRAGNLEQYDGIVKTIQSYLDIGDALESRLSELKMPTLIIHGDADSRINVDCGRQLQQGIAGSNLHIIPRAEHGLLTNESIQTRNLILSFLAQVTA